MSCTVTPRSSSAVLSSGTDMDENAITAAELLVAQSLGPKFRFAFVNTLTGIWQEKSLNEVFAASRAMYPAWHIRF